MTGQSTVEQILNLGRWAPSGDNTQPWRFEIVDDLRVVVHGFDTRDHCVYDLDGHPSQISLGALLETISIAASAHGLRVDSSRRSTLPNRPLPSTCTSPAIHGYRLIRWWRTSPHAACNAARCGFGL